MKRITLRTKIQGRYCQEKLASTKETPCLCVWRDGGAGCGGRVENWCEGLGWGVVGWGVLALFHFGIFVLTDFLFCFVFVFIYN